MTSVQEARRTERVPRAPVVRPAAERGPSDGAGLPRGICLYTPSFDASGMGAHMLDLAAAWARHTDVAFMAWPTPAGQRLLDRAAELGARPLPLPRPRDPRFADVVGQYLRLRPPDVFHVHVGTGREDFDGARAARSAGVGAVLQTQHLPWLMGSHKHRVPLLHALDPVDHVITVSEGQRRTYEQAGVPPETMTTVPNGIRPRGPGPGREAARRALGLDPGQPVVLTVGRLTVMKGHRHLLDAVPELVRRFPDVAVVVIGQGHLHGALTEQAAALEVADSVHLVGHRPDARDLLDAADVFVLPSRTEGMPLALLEAMDAGLPVVATRIIGSEEVVVDGETGLLVPARKAPGLSGALIRMLEDPALRERCGRAGRQRFLTHFTSARMAAETAAVYDRVLRRADGAAGRSR